MDGMLHLLFHCDILVCTAFGTTNSAIVLTFAARVATEKEKYDFSPFGTRGVDAPFLHVYLIMQASRGGSGGGGYPHSFNLCFIRCPNNFRPIIYTQCHRQAFLVLPSSSTSGFLWKAPAMSFIHTFPSEVLNEIFKWTMPSTLLPITVTHVCRRWREAALGNSDLWRNIVVATRDTRHMPLVSEFLERSKQRTIRLAFEFSELPAVLDRDARWSLLKIVRKHLRRCYSLSITTEWDAWVAMIVIFHEETYENLVALELRMVVPSVIPSLYAHLTLPPFPLPLPAHHPLKYISLNGMSVEDNRLPHLRGIRIIKEAPRLQFWLAHSAERLCLEDFRIPTTFPPALPTNTTHCSPIIHLVLARLSATRLAPHGNREHSCVPFFRGLDTPHLRVLEIIDWDVRGRAWGDFIAALPSTMDKYPVLTGLRICGMHFVGLSYREMHFFLASFPALERLRLQDCFAGTWETALEVLEVDETLCPGLTQIGLDAGLVLIRDDPLPLRNATILEHSKEIEA
ncbi:hypothetical protein C8R44DRAFT_746087 [Mycena epipterygia]|nr:hypothetical protein C8R44DRAFT_746087 [Mycena epipterygia]